MKYEFIYKHIWDRERERERGRETYIDIIYRCKTPPVQKDNNLSFFIRFFTSSFWPRVYNISFKITISVVFWPSTQPNMIFQSDAPEGSDTFRWQLWEEIVQADLADEMEQGKSPWYPHRLMHRKRVISELHDSYFRLMTIKHAIPKIEWATELLYNSMRTESLDLEIRRVWERCGRESHHPAEGALGTPDGVLGPDQLVIRCSKESQQSGPRASGWASGQRERHDADGHKSGGQYIAVPFSLQLPLIRKPYNKVRGIFF